MMIVVYVCVETQLGIFEKRIGPPASKGPRIFNHFFRHIFVNILLKMEEKNLFLGRNGFSILYRSCNEMILVGPPLGSKGPRFSQSFFRFHIFVNILLKMEEKNLFLGRNAFSILYRAVAK